jgi:F-type H+-transporting ATPase subunit b
LEALGLNLGYLLVQILNFAILFVVLRAWVFKPILNMLEKRRQTIAQSLEDARVAAEARANAEKEAQAVLAGAQAEAAARIKDAAERAEQAAAEIKHAAEQEAHKLHESAAAEAEQSKLSVLAELRGQVGALAIAAAQRLIGEALDERRQRELIAEFFSGVTGGKVVLMEGENLPGGAAEVTSALPLTPDEQATLRRDILGKMGAGATIAFRVDPKILGGVIIRAGAKVLDGSVAGKLESLRQSLS